MTDPNTTRDAGVVSRHAGPHPDAVPAVDDHPSDDSYLDTRHLADLLLAGAAPYLAEQAAIVLLARHNHFFDQPSFQDSCITCACTIDGDDWLAHIDYTAALAVLEAGELPCTHSQQAVLRIAASIADTNITIHLGAWLGNLDHRSITLVTEAINYANNGHPHHAGHLDERDHFK